MTHLTCFATAAALAVAGGLTPSSAAAQAIDTQGAAGAPALTEKPRWRTDLYASMLPGLGEAKRGSYEGGSPELNFGLGARVQTRLGELFSAGFGLSGNPWNIEGSMEDHGGLSSGTFLDAGLVLEFHPVHVVTPGGPLELYLTASGGPTLFGGELQRPLLTPSGAPQPDARELLRFEAGYHASSALGLRFEPFRRLGVFVEAGLDFHYAMYTRRVLDLNAVAAGAPQAASIAEPLWFSQGALRIGASYRF